MMDRTVIWPARVTGRAFAFSPVIQARPERGGCMPLNRIKTKADSHAPVTGLEQCLGRYIEILGRVLPY